MRLATSCSFVRQALVTKIGGFIESELEINRIGRNNSGKHRRVAAGAAGNKIARRDAPVANAAIHRRAQFGELHVELGLAYGRLVVAHRSLGVTESLRALLEGLIGDRLVAHELLAARIVGFGVGQIGLRLHQIGAGLIERVLEWPLVDGEQKVALFDHLPIFEMQALEITRDAGAHLDRIYGGEAADIFVEIKNRALDRLCHGNGRRGWTTLRLAFAAACDQSRKRQRDCELLHATHQRK